MADLIRLPAVTKRTGFCRAKIYLLMASGDFPKPIALGARAVAWVDSEVSAWINKKIAQGREAAGDNAKAATAKANHMLAARKEKSAARHVAA